MCFPQTLVPGTLGLLLAPDSKNRTSPRQVTQQLLPTEAHSPWGVSTCPRPTLLQGNGYAGHLVKGQWRQVNHRDGIY